MPASKKEHYVYSEAQKAIKRLGIKGQEDYKVRYRQDPKLPSNPEREYSTAGWSGWPDFLGIFYYTYAEAQWAVQVMGIEGKVDYDKRHSQDPRLPATPSRKYAATGWISWYEFLGKQKPPSHYTYTEAQVAVQAMGVKSTSEYEASYRRDPRLPCNPRVFYVGKGWTNWYDFLGKERSPFFATYAEAQTAAQNLGIKGFNDYRRRRAECAKLPFHPEKLYANSGWTNWNEFLGLEKISFASYSEASLIVKSLHIKSKKAYLTHYKENKKLPSNPHIAFANSGWNGWHEFLGIDTMLCYKTYDEARDATRRLGLNSVEQYRANYLEDPRLPAQPDKFYANAGWINWYHLFGKETPDFYPTYSMASAAVIALNIQSVSEYRNRHKEDSRLHSNPQIRYAEQWDGWSDFLGKKIDLYSYSEARDAVQAIGIKTSTDYRNNYELDPRLPRYPQNHYAKTGWIDWYELFGREKPKFYPTYDMAVAATKALGITSREEYTANYRQDPMLSSTPYILYRGVGWTNWYEFLGSIKPNFYTTYDEAQQRVWELGIKSIKDYTMYHQEDSKLPSHPAHYYASNWTGWPDFLGMPKPADPQVDYPTLWADIEKWLEDEVNINSKSGALKAFLSEYMKPLGLPDDPRYLLHRKNQFDTTTYQQFIESQGASRKRPIHSGITAFFKWALNEYCTDVDADERIVLPEFRNPFETVLAGFAESLENYRPNESTKLALGYEYILRARQFLVPDGDQAFVTQPSLRSLPHLQKFFDNRLDWVDIDESQINRADPNCIWRLRRLNRVIDGRNKFVDVYQVWSPVRFIALYTLLRIPLRGQQILWLDSGEADDEVAHIDVDNRCVAWRKNTCLLAGKGSKKRHPQAAVHRGYNDLPNLYVTTNKTGRKDGGYVVDWIPDDLVYWFLMLRDWQSQYNSLSEPTTWLATKGSGNTNDKILKARGTQCFLFRGSSGKPLSTQITFEANLAALLNQIQRPGENLVTIITDALGSRLSSPYTPHSLRVSLITAFVVDGDAPIHIMSKLVGHSSLVMTIYYIKLNSGQMRRVMGEAEKRAATVATERQCDTIRAQGLHPLRSILIATDGNRSLIEQDVPNSACVVFDWGLCPMSAAFCHIGGELLVEKPEKQYGPVDAGYLGQKNCLRCRFFITGVPFLIGLTALANEIALEIHIESGRFKCYEAEVVALEQEYYDACQTSTPDVKQSQRKQATANEQQSAGKLDSLLNDYAAINHYVKSCLKLIKNSNQDGVNSEGVRLVLTGEFQEIGVTVEESRSQYHLLAEICQNATIYQSANPSRAIPLISQAIDRMAANNNLAPAMFRLTDEQKLIVINELNNLLLERLGSWERIEDLFSGDLMLLDIDSHEPELTRISTEIQNLLLHGSTLPLSHELKRHG